MEQNLKYAAEIERAYETQKAQGLTKSLEDFAAFYKPTKENEIDLSKVAKLREMNATGIKFDAKPATSNLTAAQQVEFKARQKALGITPIEKKMEIKAAAAKVDLRKEKYAKYKADFGKQFNITEVDYLKMSDEKIENTDMDIQIAVNLGQLPKPKDWTTEKKKTEKLSLYQQQVNEKGWRTI